ncbi:MAG: hypothetical protein JWL90_351 [Chthoniobacteraceae bacterium]|nr:hypothetical protein [Chthoniobacteraceae bacterium]
MRVRPSRTPFICPVCGEQLLASAKACPSCGACERSGWSQDADYDGLDLPDEDDHRYLIGEFGGRPKKTFREHLWWIIAVLLLLAMGSVLFRA